MAVGKVHKVKIILRAGPRQETTRLDTVDQVCASSGPDYQQVN